MPTVKALLWSNIAVFIVVFAFWIYNFATFIIGQKKYKNSELASFYLLSFFLILVRLMWSISGIIGEENAGQAFNFYTGNWSTTQLMLVMTGQTALFIVILIGVSLIFIVTSLRHKLNFIISDYEGKTYRKIIRLKWVGFFVTALVVAMWIVMLTRMDKPQEDATSVK